MEDEEITEGTATQAPSAPNHRTQTFNLASPFTTNIVLLQTSGLTKKFKEFVAVNEVDLAIQENELHSVIGPNGAGKTTLFNLLMGVYEPTAGRIEIEGTDITTEPVHKRPYLGISRSYQISNIYPSLTVFENLQTAVGTFHGNYYDMLRPISSNDTLTEKTEQLISRLGFEDRRETAASALSHGDKRHLEIGMSLAAEPQLLLLDEPTSDLDPRNTAVIEDAMAEARERGIGVVVATHDMHQAERVADRVAVLLGTDVAEVGETSRVFSQPSDERTRKFISGELVY